MSLLFSQVIPPVVSWAPLPSRSQHSQLSPLSFASLIPTHLGSSQRAYKYSRLFHLKSPLWALHLCQLLLHFSASSQQNSLRTLAWTISTSFVLTIVTTEFHIARSHGLILFCHSGAVSIIDIDHSLFFLASGAYKLVCFYLFSFIFVS